MAPCGIPLACIQHSTVCTLHAKGRLGFGSASVETAMDVFVEIFAQEEMISNNQENRFCTSSFDDLNNKTLLASSGQIYSEDFPIAWIKNQPINFFMFANPTIAVRSDLAPQIEPNAAGSLLARFSAFVQCHRVPVSSKRRLIEGSLEVQLLTKWTDGKAKPGRSRASKKFGRGESQKGEDKRWRKSEERKNRCAKGYERRETLCF